ncbi:diguanylate cyclase [Arcobacter sp. LA11]|uniref:sensor domain-containing diguanylate cyclase n=1 Tax=Arcobacter sp. LA11 TaxID=1898176 RepID=UPI0009344028|nr:diguanylate cyclase [Arcobacter sp. LA11]
MNKLLHYLNESPTVFFILKKDDGLWELEYVTDNVINIYGKTSEDFLNKKYHHEDFIHKVDLKKFNDEASKISRIEGDTFNYTPYRVLKGSMTSWISHTTKIIRDEDGKPKFYYGYITDITDQKNLNEKLNNVNTVLDSIFNNSFNLILLLDNRGKLIKANETSLEIAGYKEQDVINRYFWDLPWWNYCTSEEKDILREEINIVKMGSSLKNNKHYYDTTGQKIEVDFCFSPVFDRDLNVTHILCEAHDITQSKNIQKRLDQYMRIVNDNVYITISDLTGKIVNVSDAYCKLTGYLRDELIDKKHSIFRHPDTEGYVFKELWSTINKGRLWKGEHKNRKKDGSTFWVENSITPNLDENGNITGYTSIYNDITDKKEISELLITDYLTKIYNRRHFNDIFEIELKRARRDQENFILMVLDIDYFKQYNDTYGHDAGDKALQLVANSLKYTLNRAHDFVFRLGGEEFGIITSKIGISGVKTLANKLKQSIENLEIEHKGNKVSNFITISIGTKIVSPESVLNQNDIYKLADNALYEAKDFGRNRAVISKKDTLRD